MPANVLPIFSKVGSVSTNGTTGMSQLITTANNDYLGTHANAFLIWTADATNGGLLDRVVAKAGGTNVASVCRFYLNNGSTNGTATNNAFIAELSLPATTASAVVTTADLVQPFNIALDPGFRLYGCLATAVAAGWTFVGIGGKY
jgi:hypothetical protein